MSLPPLSARWAAALLEAPLLDEPMATCDRCVMQRPIGVAPEAGDVWFGAGKCCTYQPVLHNFLAGRILLDPGLPRAHAHLEAAMAAGAGVSPLGVTGRRSYWLLYDAGGAATFGRADALRCPLFEADTGRCGVWRHREATCATWFCKHARGAAGQSFWIALRNALQAAEVAVARALCLELGVDPEALAALVGAARSVGVEDVDGAADPEARRCRWKGWAGREREFFEACARRAEALSAEEVMAMGGAELALWRAVLRARSAALGAPLDGARLRLGAFEVARAGPDGIRVRTYSTYDPLDVPPALLSALARFDGRPTPEVIAEIAAEDRIQIDAGLLATLVDFGVLCRRESAP